MLKKLGLRKLAVTTSALFIIGLIYLFPSNNEDLKIEKNITYIEPDEIYEVYLVDQNNYVSMVTLPLDSTELSDILKEKVEYLIIDGEKQNDVPNGFKPIIPEGTKILDLKIEDDTVTINFNENIKNPVLINKNDILTLSNNMYLRSDMPKNTDDYYKNIKAITILNKGTKITIIDKAIGIKRKHATQWWIHVSY